MSILARWALVLLGLAGAAACRPRPVPTEVSPSERVEARDGGVSFVYRAEPPKPAEERASLPGIPQAGPGPRPAISVFAGVPGGRGDLDGTGREARIGLVAGMARVDDAIVFADEGDGSIRRFDPTSGAVTTLARLPRAPGGIPSLPWGLAYDGKGHVYVADRSAHTVLALDLATSALKVVLGKPGVRGDATGATETTLLDSPAAIAVQAGVLYVADVGNHRILRADVAKGTADTLARGFMQPWGLCVDDGALIVADSLQEALFRVDPRSGTSTVLAGSNRFGYAGKTNGPARVARFRTPRGLDCTGGSVLIADHGNARVRRLDLAAATVSLVAGSSVDDVGYRDGQSGYSLFQDVESVLSFGDSVYIGDDAALRVVSLSDGMVKTAAGAGARTVDYTLERNKALDIDAIERGELFAPEGLVVSAPDGAAFVAGGRSGVLHRIDLATGSVTVFAGNPWGRGFVDAWATDARFGMPTALTTDGQGTLFVGDRQNHAVRAVSIATRRVTTVVGTPSLCGNADGPVGVATFCDPAGLAFRQGVLFVADASSHTIRRVDLAAGTVATVAGTAFAPGNADGFGATARLSSPSALAFVGDALFVVDGDDGRVRRVDVTTGEVSSIAGARFDGPSALARGEGDTLLVVDRAAVSRLSIATGKVEKLFSAGPGLRTGTAAPALGHPASLVELASGDALVVDRSENAVLRLLF